MKKLFREGIFKRDTGFIVQGLFIVFQLLGMCSIFSIVRKIGKAVHERIGDKDKKAFVDTYTFPELWVIFNIVLALFGAKATGKVWCWIALIYASLRILEMFVYQVNVMFFDRLKYQYLLYETEEKKNEDKDYKVFSITRTVILMIFNMVEYVLQFEVIFVAVHTLFGTIEPSTNLSTSFGLFMNLYDPMEAGGNYILKIAYFETMIGMFMNIVCLARFVGMLPQIESITKN